jgi:phospholipase C
MKINRRNFLKAAGTSAAFSLFPPSIQRALAISAASDSGTIDDVKHIILVMQENRSFDHYYGTMPGVRGYSDRFPIPTPNGSIWNQTGVAGQIQPFRLDTTSYNGYWIGGNHSWNTMHAAWNQGVMSGWPLAKKLDGTMGYLDQPDLPFYRALASAFTVCDAYHCSVLGPTQPNRIFWETGTNGAIYGQGAVIATEDCWQLNNPPAAGLTWQTMPETLMAAGISTKFYYGVSPGGKTSGTLCGAFQTFRQANVNLAALGSPSTPFATMAANSTLTPAQVTMYGAFGNTMPTLGPAAENDSTTKQINGVPINGVLVDLAADIANGTLPQVSWVRAPGLYQEHPLSSTGPQGEYWMEALLNTLTANPEVWAKTVLLINYDENDAFFDHMPPPCPPSPNGTTGAYYGASNVDTSGEYLTMGSFPGDTTPFSPDGNPVGPGMRVPMLVISPWSVGGYVNSQVFDHTSTLRFIEQVFKVTCPNITKFRRAVMGDMTSCFNFVTPNTAVPALPSSPDTNTVNAIYNFQQSAPAQAAPAWASTALPQQPLPASGLTPSRALPYKLHTTSSVDPVHSMIKLTFSNTGTQAAVFHVYDQLNLTTPPRRYVVDAGTELADQWTVSANTPAGQYGLFVHGPNGFHRLFEGNVAQKSTSANPEIQVCYDETNNAVYLAMVNSGVAAANITVTANAYRTDGPWTYTVAAGAQLEVSWSLTNTHNWYDFSVSSDGGAFTRRFAGRLENGQDGVSDPAMGVAVAPATTAN